MLEDRQESCSWCLQAWMGSQGAGVWLLGLFPSSSPSLSAGFPVKPWLSLIIPKGQPQLHEKNGAQTIHTPRDPAPEAFMNLFMSTQPGPIIWGGTWAAPQSHQPLHPLPWKNYFATVRKIIWKQVEMAEDHPAPVHV